MLLFVVWGMCRGFVGELAVECRVMKARKLEHRSAKIADSESRYGLTRMVIGSRAFLEIERPRYESIRAAKEALAEALALEQKFELVVANLIDFEKTLTSIATDSLFRH